MMVVNEGRMWWLGVGKVCSGCTVEIVSEEACGDILRPYVSEGV